MKYCDDSGLNFDYVREHAEELSKIKNFPPIPYWESTFEAVLGEYRDDFRFNQERVKLME